MQSTSSAFLSLIPAENFKKRLHQLSIHSEELQGTIQSAFPEVADSDTMAIAAFTLGDLQNDKKRREAVASMWESGAEVIVLIDRGTPRGFDIVATARDQLLRLGRHQKAAVSGATIESTTVVEEAIVQDDEEIIEIDGLTYYAEGSELATMEAPPNPGCHVVAPVSHLL